MAFCLRPWLPNTSRRAPGHTIWAYLLRFASRREAPQAARETQFVKRLGTWVQRWAGEGVTRLTCSRHRAARQKGITKTTVKTCLEQKPHSAVIFSVGPDDKLVTVLQLMRDKLVRAVLVIEAERLKGIVTQGDCAIKVLLPGLDA